MSMTNNDDLALSMRTIAENAISEEGATWWSEWQLGHKDGLALHGADAKFIALANPSNILSLLAERDADKKRIEMLEKYVNERDAQNQELLLNIGSLQQRLAELEARTVSVKLPENTPLAEAPEHIWLQTAGVWPENGEFSELTWCSDNQHRDDTLYVRADLAAGIKLEVGE